MVLPQSTDIEHQWTQVRGMLRVEVGDGAVQRGAAQGHGPQAGGQTLVRHGGGDPPLGGAQGGADPAHPHGQGVGQGVGQGIGLGAP